MIDHVRHDQRMAGFMKSRETMKQKNKNQKLENDVAGNERIRL